MNAIGDELRRHCAEIDSLVLVVLRPHRPQMLRSRSDERPVLKFKPEHAADALREDTEDAHGRTIGSDDEIAGREIAANSSATPKPASRRKISSSRWTARGWG